MKKFHYSTNNHYKSCTFTYRPMFNKCYFHAFWHVWGYGVVHAVILCTIFLKQFTFHLLQFHITVTAPEACIWIYKCTNILLPVRLLFSSNYHQSFQQFVADIKLLVIKTITIHILCTPLDCQVQWHWNSFSYIIFINFLVMFSSISIIWPWLFHIFQFFCSTCIWVPFT